MAPSLRSIRLRLAAAIAGSPDFVPPITKAAPDFQQPIGLSAQSTDQAMMRAMESEFGLSGPNVATLGPGVPPPVQPLDRSGEPRVFSYRVGWNVPSLPGEGRPVDLDTLQDLADTYDLMRKAIEIRKDELCIGRFDVIAREQDRHRARSIIQEQQEVITKIKRFFEFPDRDHTFQSWIRMILEQYFIFDAVSLYKWKTLDNELYALRILDGKTIKPLLSVQGDRPSPPTWAYQQFLYGLPVWSFTTDELVYAPKNRRAHTPYGFSPVEQFIWHITQALKFQRWNLDFFTDGTIPEGVAEAPASWTPEQIKEFNAYWDALLSGDTRALRKLQFVPAGFVYHQFKPYTFDKEFARYLVTLTASAFDVTVQELGFEPEHAGMGGRGVAEEQSKILRRKSTGPTVRWLMDEIVNPIIWNDFGAKDLQGTIILETEQENEMQVAQARDLAIRNGTMSIDQAAEEDGAEAPGIGRIFTVGGSIYGEPDLIALTNEGRGALAPMPQPPPGNLMIPNLTPANYPDPVEQDQRETGGLEANELPVHREDVPKEASNGEAGNQDAGATPPGGWSSRNNFAPHNLQRPKIGPQAEYAAEIRRFVSFVGKRRKTGNWRDFESDVIPAAVMLELNVYARNGAPVESIQGVAKTLETLVLAAAELKAAA